MDFEYIYFNKLLIKLKNKQIMKKIAIVLFASITLTSCCGDSSKCEKENADTCKVAAATSTPTDSTTVDTATSVK